MPEEKKGMPPRSYNTENNPLGHAPIGGLIVKYAVPAIIGMLVGSAYNVADQIFIGNVVGMYGNGATNVAFPLVTMCNALSQLTGIGTASNFNINMGAGKKTEAARFIGNGLAMVVLAGILLSTITLIFLKPLMIAFGATENVLPLALEYTGITLFGFPFLIFSSACSHLIRADGKPTYSMVCMIVGAVLNVFLDYLLMFPFQMGVKGAAYATVISQIVSGTMVIIYMIRYRSVKITPDLLILKLKNVVGIVKLGAANCINQFIMMAVQVTMNNVLTKYGAISIYGNDIPLAVSGVITKISMITVSLSVGTALGCQPILGFNTGAEKYDRVKTTYKKAVVAVLTFSIISFILFQLFPRQIVSVFGSGDELYYQFAERYMRIFLMMVCIYGIQPISINFFTSTGKAKQGIFLTLTRQGLLLLPLLFILPAIIGIDGVLIAGPVSDFTAVTLCLILVTREMRRMTELQRRKNSLAVEDR